MRRWVRLLLLPLFVLLSAAPVFAALPVNPTVPLVPIIRPTLAAPIPVAFGAVPNRYTDIDPATTFDLNGDLVGDVIVSGGKVTGKNGSTVQLLDPPALNLDQVQEVPAAGYVAEVAAQLSRVYVAKLSGGGYAKFMLLQSSPKVTIWFHHGAPTTSKLAADGSGGHATLTWGALADAQLGYNVYRYEFLDNNAYSVTLLNDFTVQETTYIDNTALNRYYLYVVVAIKSNGAFGASTTVAPVQVQSVQRNLVLSLTAGTAKLDGTAVTLDAPLVIKNGRLMTPASVLENAGVEVDYVAATGQITLKRRLENVTYTLVMTLNVPDYTWNGSSYKADVPPYLAGSVVMIPIRVAAPALAFGLSFNSADRTATVQWFE